MDVSERVIMITTMLGTSESTDPKPRRKTDEYDSVKLKCSIKTQAIDEHQERMRVKREEKELWEY